MAAAVSLTLMLSVRSAVSVVLVSTCSVIDVSREARLCGAVPRCRTCLHSQCVARTSGLCRTRSAPRRQRTRCGRCARRGRQAAGRVGEAGLARRPGPPRRRPTRCRGRASPASRRAPARPARCTGAAPRRRPGHAVGHLARAGGEVEGALPGDHQVGPAGALGQPDRLGDQRRSRAAGSRRAAAARSPSPPAAPAPCGRARARWSVALGEPLQRGVDGLEPVAAHALLRAVDVGRADQAEQRVVHVGGDHQLDLREPRPGGREVDRARGRPGRAARRSAPPAGSTVGARGRRAARLPRRWCRSRPARRRPGGAPASSGRRDQLADAVGASPARASPLRLRGQVQPAGLGALDVRRVVRRISTVPGTGSP